MRGPTHITGNRLDRVMTNVPDIVEVIIVTPLGTSDHCFDSCVVRVEQSVPEYMSEVLSLRSIVPTGTASTVQSGALHGVPF